MSFFVGLGVALTAGLGVPRVRRTRLRFKGIEQAAARAADARAAWSRFRSEGDADPPEGLVRSVAGALLRPGLSRPEIRTELGPPDAMEGDEGVWVYLVPRESTLHQEVLRIYFDETQGVRAWETSVMAADVR